MNNYETIIGVEIHIELNSKTKAFSPSKNYYDSEENTNIFINDLGYPGSLPLPNMEVITKSALLAKALKMQIDTLVRYDRKNYFYPDLVKGFQITQQFHPIGKNGSIPIEISGEKKEISIERIHMEEDTAKSIHENNITKLNYNRSGVPLVEIVTEPVIRSGEEAKAYIETIQSLVKRLNISDAKMEEGSLRADINISVRPFGFKNLLNKVEIKNMNSTSNVVKAVEMEVSDQINKYNMGLNVDQVTKRYDDSNNKNVVMRKKSDAIDYKYFPETNIPPINLGNNFIEKLVLPELPWETKKRLIDQGVSIENINQLINDKEKLKFFDDIDFSDSKKKQSIFFSEIVAFTNKKNISFKDIPFDSKEIITILDKQKHKIISGKHIKQIVPILFNGKKTTNEIINENNLKIINDEKLIKEWINETIENNSEFISKNKERPERLSKFISGQVMKISKGNGNPEIINKIINKTLNL
ncbi:MAG: Asp-tRNA(Asn)/Glu-tRNA(Gln) amidotransferase subunit GatB [Mollicutes bacterium PWAP]|nr:Asp-tRNA(Asn)/Glu-tRNA(Gln) amidotransferase subunit GatB [Mollicutes bacterium PWAP]